MRTTFTHSLLLCILIPGEFLFSQQNIIKTNLPGWFILNYNLAYERAITPKYSVQLSSSLLDPVRFNIDFLTHPEKTGFAANPVIRSFFLTAECRRYFSKKQQAPEGFYVAGFLRFFRYTLNMDYRYQKDSATTVDANGFARYWGLGPGANIGYQARLGSHVTLDIFAGLGVGGGGFKLRVRDDILTPGDFEDIAGRLGDIKIKFDGFSVYYTENEAGLSVGVGPIIMARAGLALGVRF